MKVIELRSRFGIDALGLADRPQPRPGPGEVLVKMQAASLNYRDLQVVRGEFPGIQLPFVPLSDGAGEVVETGASVRRFKVGDRVCPCYVQDWVEGPPTPEAVSNRLGSTLDGILAEYVSLPEHGVIRQPHHLSFVEAATLPIAGVTAWEALFPEHSSITRDSTVLVQGTGGVATFALQLARSIGARVIVTSRSEQKLAHARDLGAVGVSAPGWVEDVLTLTNGRGVDQALNVAGGNTLAQSISATRLGGIINVVGYLDSSSATIDIPTALRRMVTLRALSVGSRAAFEALVTAYEARSLRPVVDRVFPFEEAALAFNYLASGAHMGKVALTFDGGA